MREILFRGKRIDNGEWVEGAYCPFNLNSFGEREEKPHIIIISDDKNIDGLWCEAIPETIGQYTGLTDRNGVRIFEGDIVKADDYIFYIQYGKCGGVQNSDNFGYMGFYLAPLSEGTKVCSRYGLRDDICYFTNIEVIGNIHDNPELLVSASQSDSADIAQNALKPATPENFELMPG